MEPRSMIGRNLDTCKRGPLTKQTNGLRTSGGRSGGWREQAMANIHRNIHSNTHTNSVPGDTQGGWSLGQ